MESECRPQKMTRELAASRVQAAIFLATLSILLADGLGLPGINFFALWGVGWLIISWAMLPEERT